MTDGRSPAERRDRAVSRLDADDPDERRAAARSLFELADANPAVVAPAEAAVLEAREDDAAWPYVHGVLRRLPDERVDGIDRETALRGEDPERRWLAAESCVRSVTGTDKLAESTVDALIDRATDHAADPRTRSAAVLALSRRDRCHAGYRSRPPELVPTLVELVEVGTPRGRAAAAAMAVDTVVEHGDRLDEETFAAVVGALATALADDADRVRLEAAGALADRQIDPLEGHCDLLVEPLAAARRGEGRAAERAREVDLPGVDVPDPTDDAGGDGDLPSDLPDRVEALREGEYDLADRTETLVEGVESDDWGARRQACGAARDLARTDPGAVPPDLRSALASVLASNDSGATEAAEALARIAITEAADGADGTDRDAGPRAVERSAVVEVLANFAASAAQDLDVPLDPTGPWLALAVVAGAHRADRGEHRERVRSYLADAAVSPVDLLAAGADGDPQGLGPVLDDLRDRTREGDPVAGRALLLLAALDPSILGGSGADGHSGDATGGSGSASDGPLVVDALAAVADDEEGRQAALAATREIAEATPGRLAVPGALDRLVDHALNPDDAVRDAAARACWHVGRAVDGGDDETEDRGDDPAPGSDADPAAAVARLADYDLESVDRRPLWPAGVLARVLPERTERAAVDAVEGMEAAPHTNRSEGEAVGALLAEVHAGDPAVGAPAVDRLLATFDRDDPPPVGDREFRANAMAALATVADRYADRIADRVDAVVECALTENWSTDRRMQNAVLVLEALAEDHDDAVYAALRDHVGRDGGSDRGSHDAILRRRGYLDDESERVADLYVDAVLAERAVDRERLTQSVEGLLADRTVEDLLALWDPAAVVPELVAAASDREEWAGDLLAELVAEQPSAVAGHADRVGDLLDDHWKRPRRVGADVCRALAAHDPTVVRPCAVSLAARVLDDEDRQVVRACLDSLTRLADRDPALVRAALEDRLDHYSIDPDAPAAAVDRLEEFDDGGLDLVPGGDPSPAERLRSLFETVGIDPDRTAED